MARPESAERGTVFDLAAIERELRLEAAYLREGHTARTLLREAGLRIVLVAMKAGATMAEHSVDETAAVHVLVGRVQLRLPDRSVDVPAGHVLVLDKGVAHDVAATAESAFLLTLGWKHNG